jgi:hypothetical protein
MAHTLHCGSTTHSPRKVGVTAAARRESHHRHQHPVRAGPPVGASVRITGSPSEAVSAWQMCDSHSKS